MLNSSLFPQFSLIVVSSRGKLLCYDVHSHGYENNHSRIMLLKKERFFSKGLLFKGLRRGLDLPPGPWFHDEGFGATWL